MNEYSYETYRPQKYSNKLERLGHAKEWAPSIHYKNSLNEIRAQPTPSEVYRAKARTLGRDNRETQRIELTIQMNYEKYSKAALLIQRYYRGMKRRINFQTIKGSLELARKQRFAREKAMERITVGDWRGAIECLDTISEPPISFLVMKAKLHYSLGEFQNSQQIAQSIIESSPTQEDGHFILVSSLASQNLYDLAYDTIRNALANFEYPREDLVRIHGLICMKVDPPLFAEAREIFDGLVERRADDMNALLKRASCHICLHDWNKAVEDLSLILHYQPKLVNVICLRARVYTCQRDWESARKDFKRVLRMDPNCEAAILGLADMDQNCEETTITESSFTSEL